MVDESTMLSRSPSSVVLTMPTGLFSAISTRSSASRGSINRPLTFDESPGFHLIANHVLARACH